MAGGTSSNVMCYLGKGDVALSISMTAISTMVSVILTPFVLSGLIGGAVNVPVLAIMQSLFLIVIIPVLVGVFINTNFVKATQKIGRSLPFISMLSILIIIAVVIALNKSELYSMGGPIIYAVILHNVSGLILGYYLALLLGFETKVCRTIAFEVGLQNSGLATALALKYFSPTAAIPGALFSVWHNISGSILSGYWNRTIIEKDNGPTE